MKKVGDSYQCIDPKCPGAGTYHDHPETAAHGCPHGNHADACNDVKCMQRARRRGQAENSATSFLLDRQDIGRAIARLREARDYLRGARAPRAAAYVARALKSAEGAERHADHRLMRATERGA